jgi:hypothetical protein
VWTPPLKLVDGVWFGLDDHWIGSATKFSSGFGYTRYQLPDTAGLKVQRTDFVPDGSRGALFGLTITNPGAARTAKLSVDAHSELMGQYPWGFDGVTPNASDNLPDKGRFDGRDLVFTDDGKLPGAPEHHYAALVGTAMKPGSGTVGDQFWGPQPGHRCTGTEPGAPAEPEALAVRRRPVRPRHRRGADLLAVPAGRRLDDRVAGGRGLGRRTGGGPAAAGQHPA